MDGLELFQWSHNYFPTNDRSIASYKKNPIRRNDARKGNVPGVFFYDIRCFQLFYDKTDNKFKQFSYKANGEGEYDYLNSEPELERIREGSKYGYVIDRELNVYAWPIEMSLDVQKKIGIIYTISDCAEDIFSNMQAHEIKKERNTVKSQVEDIIFSNHNNLEKIFYNDSPKYKIAQNFIRSENSDGVKRGDFLQEVFEKLTADFESKSDCEVEGEIRRAIIENIEGSEYLGLIYPYFGHLTFGVYIDFIESLGFMELDCFPQWNSLSELYDKEKIKQFKNNKRMRREMMDCLQNEVNRSQAIGGYGESFARRYSHGYGSASEKSGVYAAGEFVVIGNKLSLKTDQIEYHQDKYSDLARSGHYQPFGEEDISYLEVQKKMCDQLLKLLERSKGDNPFYQAIFQYGILIQDEFGYYRKVVEALISRAANLQQKIDSGEHIREKLSEEELDLLEKARWAFLAGI